MKEIERVVSFVTLKFKLKTLTGLKSNIQDQFQIC